MDSKFVTCKWKKHNIIYNLTHIGIKLMSYILLLYIMVASRYSNYLYKDNAKFNHERNALLQMYLYVYLLVKYQH